MATLYIREESEFKTPGQITIIGVDCAIASCNEFYGMNNHHTNEHLNSQTNGTPSPPKAKPKSPYKLQTRRLSEVAIKQIPWLVPGFILSNKVNLIDGDPGSNKSTFTIAMAAMVSTGKGNLFGCEYYVEPANVLIIAAEDAASDTIKPRAVAAGADCHRIHELLYAKKKDGGIEFIDLDKHLPGIKALIKKQHIKLLIIDPLAAFLGEKIKPKDEVLVRSLMMKLQRLAEQTGVTIIAIRHLNKSLNPFALYRGTGSIAFTGAARSVLLIAKDPDADPQDGARIVAQTKVNLAPHLHAWRFFVKEKDVPCDGSSEVNKAVYIDRWEQADQTANELLECYDQAKPSSGQSGKTSKLEKAKDLLAQQLADAPKRSDYMLAAAKVTGISPATLCRAAQEMRVQSIALNVEGTQQWWYCAPGQQPPA
jgi:hypothetical protein